MKSNKYLIIFITIVLSMNIAFANNVKLATTITTEAESVLVKKDNAIDLKTLKSMVVNDGVDVKISYERLVQAQKEIGSARAQYFPYGVGTVATVYFYGAFSYLVLAELITSLPSKIFNVQKRKHIRNAQRENLKVITANIKNQVAKMYYNFLKDEALLKIASLELSLLESKISSIEENIELGMSSSLELDDAKYRYYTLRDVYLKYSGYYFQSLKALNTLTGTSSSAKPFILQPVGEYLSAEHVTMSTEDMTAKALNNSNELKASEFMIRAAHNNRRSVKWSILSFSGIGFGYMSKIRRSRSETNNAYFRRDSVKRNVENEVYTRKAKLLSSIGVFDQDFSLYNATKSYVEGDIAEYNAGQLTLGKLVDTEIIYLSDLRETIRTHYLALSNLDSLERVVGTKVYDEQFTEVEESSSVESLVDVNIIRKRRRVTMSVVRSDKTVKISKVEYNFNDNLFRPMTSTSARSDFSIKLKTRRKTTQVSGTATITLTNGEVINKQFQI
jgi:outer membrane protein TolC